jgi:hypothetical protein
MTVEVHKREIYGGSDIEWKITHSHENGLEEIVSLDREEVRDLKGKGF